MSEQSPKWIDSHDLPALVRGGLLPKTFYTKALLLFRNAKAWNNWALRALLALGAGHLLAGIVFFFAYNWNDLSETTKFGMVFGGMIISALAWIGLKLDRPIAQVFGISLTVLIGVFLAVFDQVFQTPSALYSGFTQWALFAFPFALVSRSPAHWTVWLLIASTAALSYLGIKLEPLYGEVFVLWALTGMAALFFGLLFVYDRVQNIWPDWARAAWFRILLVIASIGFAIVTVAGAIWGQDLVIMSAPPLSVAIGIFFYLYKMDAQRFAHKPQARIVCLVLAVSGLGLMAAIIGSRFIEETVDDVFLLGLLLGFGMMAGITLALVKTFKHFIAEFGSEVENGRVPEDNHEAGEQTNSLNLTIGRSLTVVSNALKLEPPLLSQALTDNDDEQMPWYMEMFIGLAGIVTAILGMVFFGFLLVVSLGIENEMAVMVLGLAVYGITLSIRMQSKGLFSRHFLNTLLMGGGALAVAGAGFAFEGGVGFILLSMFLSVVTLWLLRDRILEFLMAAGFSGLLAYTLWHYHISYPFIWLYVLCSVFGIGLITWPLKTGFGAQRKDRILTAAGCAFLLAPCVFSFVLFAPDFTEQARFVFGGWPERIASILVTGGAIWHLNKTRGPGEFRPSPIVLVPLLIAVALMPLGSAAALLVMLTGYILGIRSLALIGTLAQIWYISWYYYDLSMNLLNKSILLMVFGALLLIIYAIAHKRGGRHA